MKPTRYLVTISACKKKVDINEYQIMDVIAHLTDNGVNITEENCFSDHGTYRQVHWHGIAEFSGIFKGLTRFDWFSGPDDEQGIAFKIAWSRIRGRFGMPNVCSYINANKKPKGLVEQEELVGKFYKNVDIKGYPELWKP